MLELTRQPQLVNILYDSCYRFDPDAVINHITLLELFDEGLFCDKDFGWPVADTRLTSTVGVDGAEELRSELDFIC